MKKTLTLTTFLSLLLLISTAFSDSIIPDEGTVTIIRPGQDGGKPIVDSLPPDFPPIKIDVCNNPTPGFIFMESIGVNGDFGSNYLIILDSAGNVCYYKKPNFGAIDFKMQPNGLFSYGSPVKLAGELKVGPLLVQNVMVEWLILDTAYNKIDVVQMANNYLADVHEFRMLPNGNYLLVSYEYIPVDMSTVVEGGDPNAVVIGTVYQELDKNKKCVFQWRSLDRIAISDTKDDLLNKIIEHVHGNSMYLDYDGNMIISHPTTCEVLKIDMVTGEIIWRFGGAYNEFAVTGEHDENTPYYFSMQHDVKRLPNGNILMYDNGPMKDPWYSRAVEYVFDEEAKTAALEWEYRHDPDISAFAMGSVQRLWTGNTLVNWGLIYTDEYRTMTEVNPEGEVVFEMSLPSDSYSYRAYKYTLPGCQPVADVVRDELLQGNTYQYLKDTVNTGVEVFYKTLKGGMYKYSRLKKFDCSSLNPDFTGEAPVILSGRYLLSQKYIDSFTGEIHFDLSSLPAIDDPETISVYCRPKADSGVFTKLKTWYDETEDMIMAETSVFGEYVLGFDRTAAVLMAPRLMEPDSGRKLINYKPTTLLWTPTGRYDSFELQIAEDSLFNTIFLDTTGMTATKLVPSKLKSERTYYWRVRTMYRDIVSDWSNVWRLDFTKSFISVVYPNGGDTLYNTKQYVFRWQTNLADTLTVTLLNGDATQAVIVDTLFSYSGAYAWKIPVSIPEGKEYRIEVKSLKDNSLFARSSNYFTIQKKPTGVNELPEKGTSMFISPNPMSSDGMINFSLRNRELVNMKIVDRLGNVMLQPLNSTLEAGAYSVNLNVSDWAPGVYFCILTNGRTRSIGKIAVIR